MTIYNQNWMHFFWPRSLLCIWKQKSIEVLRFTNLLLQNLSLLGLASSSQSREKRQIGVLSGFGDDFIEVSLDNWYNIWPEVQRFYSSVIHPLIYVSSLNVKIKLYSRCQMEPKLHGTKMENSRIPKATHRFETKDIYHVCFELLLTIIW